MELTKLRQQVNFPLPAELPQSTNIGTPPMETPSINEILQNVQYRFKENLESNLTVIPTSQAALIIFASKVLTETITEVAFDTLQNVMTGKPFPFESDVTYGRREGDKPNELVASPPSRDLLSDSPTSADSVLYPWSVANVGHVLAAYEVYPNLEVNMFIQDGENKSWKWYFSTRSMQAFQSFCNSMSKEDPFSRYKIATTGNVIQLVP